MQHMKNRFIIKMSLEMVVLDTHNFIYCLVGVMSI